MTEENLKQQPEMAETINDASDKENEAAESANGEAALADPQIQIASLQAELEAKENLNKEYSDRVLRLQADFDNFRRRTKQEKEELSAVVVQDLISDLLPVIDNLERALAADTTDGEALKTGVDMVYKQLMTTLGKNGVELIEAVGEKFDPNFHQAVMREASSEEEDTILEELQRGYSVHGKVVRPSMVKVACN